MSTAAASASGGDIEKAWKFLSPEMKKRIAEKNEYAVEGEEDSNVTLGNALKSLVDENGAAARDDARMQAEEFNKTIRAGGPLPVIVVGQMAPVAKQ